MSDVAKSSSDIVTPVGFRTAILDFFQSPKLGSILALAAGLTVGAGLIMMLLKPAYVPLYERLRPGKVPNIVEALNRLQVEFKVDTESGLVLVPSERLSEIRFELSASGFSDNEAPGFEILGQEQSFGTSQFMENARYQHALETELSRTIGGMRNVASSRVHLALPKQSVFLRDKTKASASVMVEPEVGSIIESGQVAAIVNLVASSIPYLESTAVTVVDQWGRLLSTSDESMGQAISSTHFEYTRKLESLLSKRVEALLTPVVGAGKVRASITAEVDFSSIEQTQELFDSANKHVRSEETRYRQPTGGTAAEGVPGAGSNIPGGVAGLPGPVSSINPDQLSNQATRNYELDKTIRHTTQNPGSIQRLSAAIIVDDKSEVSESGEVTRVPLSEEELAQMTQLVREAIGFDEARGDSVIVFNQSFIPLPVLPENEAPPVWKEFLSTSSIKQILTGLSLIFLVLFVLRPAVKTLGKQPDAQRVDGLAVVGGDADSANDNGKGTEGANPNDKTSTESTEFYGDILNAARSIAENDPARVARVVKDWVKTSESHS